MNDVFSSTPPKGEAAGAIDEQPIGRQESEPPADGAEPSDLLLCLDLRCPEHQSERRIRCLAADRGPLNIGLNAGEEECPGLPVVAGLQAAEAAVELGRRRQGARTAYPSAAGETEARRIVGREGDVLIPAPTIAAVDADVEAGPGIDRDRRANRFHRHVGGIGRGRCGQRDQRDGRGDKA
jgi:hypothetical protein